jgi:hypothetical protein
LDAWLDVMIGIKIHPRIVPTEKIMLVITL